MYLTTGESFKGGNRLHVPECLNAKHFAYHVANQHLDPFSSEIVVAACLKHLDDYPLAPAEINSVLPFEFSGDVRGAFEQLASDFGLSEKESGTAQVLACEWAAIHSDPTFAGKAFLTHVLHTGPNPYVMQTMSTEIKESPDVGVYLVEHTTTLLLSKGDTVVFDPTSAHTAIPKRPATGQLLLLLQYEIDDEDEEKRDSILERYPHNEYALTGSAVFND